MSESPKPDVNQEGARIVRTATESQKSILPADLESAWAEWSRGVQKVDARAMALLRAAFEARCVEGGANAAATTGRAGGLKGGKARAKSLTKAA